MTSPLTPSESTCLLSRRRWLRGSRILPLKITTAATRCQQPQQEPDTDSVTSSTTAIGSPSSVKLLFPSLSMFNLPTTPLMSPATATETVTANKEIAPPPQFAVDHTKRHRLLKKLKPRKRIQKAYPSAFETYLFDDAVPGSLQHQGIRPVRLLLERLQAWYLLAKRLLRHFELLASVEHRVSKTYRTLDRVSIFPAPKKHRSKRIITHRNRRRFYRDERLLKIHFAFQGGVRGVCDAWQHYHNDASKDHAEFATFLRSEAMPTLSNIKRELKWMIKSIRADDRLSLRTLTLLKREAAKRLKRLDRQLVFFDQHPYHGYTKKDPWLMNAAVVKQMVKVYRQENKIHETVLRLQRETLISEGQLVEEFRRLCQHIYDMREQSTLGIDSGLQNIMTTFNSVHMDSDWINFSKLNETHLVSEQAAFRHPDHLQYPNHSHALLQPIFAARMERKSRVLHHWHEYIYVLTHAGFLHEYRNASNYPARPDASIYVPHYKVSSLATNLHHNLVFQLQPHKASRNMLKNHGCSTALPKAWRTSKTRWGCTDRWTWTLRAKSAQDMETWVQHLTESSERYRPATVNVLALSATPAPVASPSPPEIVVSPAVEEQDGLEVEATEADAPGVAETAPAVETEAEQPITEEETSAEAAPPEEPSNTPEETPADTNAGDDANTPALAETEEKVDEPQADNAVIE
ncbi:conserved hypothetical protein [Mucor ambiguus]|uniref:PH domain-containing protein n=1 Tax=Mucor ambiguus TaxID=91626 RepID=A0A0C9MQ79_9FUNG|nr:conserved hypothetical protein [Mucor ambiguus]